MSAAVVSTLFTVLSLAAAILHARLWRNNALDLAFARAQAPSDPLTVEAGYMLTGQELSRMLKMACLVGAGAASFLSPPWQSLVAFAIFAVPVLSITDSLLTARSVAKQLHIVQNR